MYTFKLHDAGERMDGEKLFTMVVTNTKWKEIGLPEFMKDTIYDDLTAYEVEDLSSRIIAEY